MVSGKWFQRKRSFKNLPKLSQNYQAFHEKQGLIAAFKNLVDHLRNLHRKYEAILCSQNSDIHNEMK